jgi:hypothetical protein
MTQPAEKVELKAETLLAYTTYIASAEASVEAKLRAEEHFPDGCAERVAQLRKGTTIIELCSGKRPLQVPDGLIHDWIGVIGIPGTTIEKTLELLQNYDNHKNIYHPEVIGSKLICRKGNDFQIQLRLRKKKIITVILDTDHDVHYFPVHSMRWACYSRTTRISEVEDAGKPTEKVRPPDTGYGFLWRLHSYWRFEETENFTCIECRAISLTRDVPSALAWIIEPILLKLPGESLKATLEATRRALTSPVAPIRS